jgi:hypothetical protein
MLLIMVGASFHVLQINSLVPSAVKWNAKNLFQLSERAAEDQGRIRDDLKCAVDNVTVLHTCLLTAANIAKTPSIKALINKQILQLEGVMTALWHVAARHLVNVQAVQPKLLCDEYDQSDIDNDLNNVDDIDLNEIAYEQMSVLIFWNDFIISFKSSPLLQVIVCGKQYQSILV